MHYIIENLIGRKKTTILLQGIFAKMENLKVKGIEKLYRNDTYRKFMMEKFWIFFKQSKPNGLSLQYE